MDDLLRRFVRARLRRRDEQRLVRLHQHHFRRRVQVLDPSFFPGRERSEDAIASLGNGAYAEFAGVPDFDGRPAFHHVVHAALPALRFLYYWRASATLCFLRKHASGALRARLKAMRNVRIHLREGFVEVAARLGESRWALPEWAPPYASAGEVRGLTVDLGRQRGKAAVQAILETAGGPLTRGEIAAIWLQSTQQLPPAEVSSERDAVAETPDPDRALDAAGVRRRVTALVERLSAEDLALLRARGYADGGRPSVPFPEVARRMGRLGAESWRLKERRVLEMFRESFDAHEAPDAVVVFCELLDA